MSDQRTSGGLLFQNSASFGLFIEGLRALQCYGKEASKDEPRKPLLDWFIGEAVARFRQNVKDYPDDLLPRYYLGVAVTTLNQHYYTLRLFESSKAFFDLGQHLGFQDLKELDEQWITPAADKVATAKVILQAQGITQKQMDNAEGGAKEALDLDKDPWPLLHEADRHFKYLEDRLAHDSGLEKVERSSLLRTVAYNRAEVYARLARQNEPDLEKALHFVQNMAGATHPVSPPWYSLRRTRLPQGVSEREAEALALQGRILQDCVQARCAIRGKISTEERTEILEPFIAPHAQIKQNGLTQKFKIIEEINNARLDPRSTIDVEADFWTKLGYVRYDIALNPTARPRMSCDRALKEAEEDLLEALTLKANWNPAQIYLALAYRVHSGVAEAMGNHADKKRFTDKADSLFASLLGTSKTRPASTGQWQIKGSVSASPDG